MAKQRLSRRWVVSSRPEGAISDENFRLETVDVGAPSPGEVTVRVRYLMMIPSLRMRLTSGGLGGVPLPLGALMAGAGLGEIVASQNPDILVGETVSGAFGWRELATGRPGEFQNFRRVKPHRGLPESLLLHLLGSNGVTAWIGLFEHGRPSPGDVLVVSAAAGSVGATVCQLGKLAGCEVIGVAGGQEKTSWLLSHGGCDAAIDYKSEDVHQRLAELAPNGANIVFDNVGGPILDQMLAGLAHGARVVLCGATSQYDRADAWTGPTNYFQLVYRRASMSGFYVHDHLARFDVIIDRIATLVRENRLNWIEEVHDGLKAAPLALANAVSGRGRGLQVVRL